MLTAKDLAGIQIMERNCNPSLGDTKIAVMIPKRYVNNVISRIREFRNFLIYLSTASAPSRKWKPFALAKFKEFEGVEMPSLSVSSQ